MEVLAFFFGLSVGMLVTITGSYFGFRALLNAVKFKTDLGEILAVHGVALVCLFAGTVVFGLILNLFGVNL